jgi:hypothetical protein
LNRFGARYVAALSSVGLFMRLIGAVWVDPLGEKKPPLKAVRFESFSTFGVRSNLSTAG